MSTESEPGILKNTRPVLILGGTGVFGKRLAHHLARERDRFSKTPLIITSRSAEKAEAIANEIRRKHVGCCVSGIALDHRHDLADTISLHRPCIVVDCSGPFQSANYDVAKTVLSAGTHFIDLADARDYLSGFPQALDELAKSHQACGFAGASSTPTLSNCVVKKLTADWQHIDTIDICITPGGRSEVGRSVIEAVMSYAGEKIPVWNHGTRDHGLGWIGARHVCMPGLGCRRVARVETFDAEQMGDLYSVRVRVSFAAGLESWLEQWGLETYARLRSHKRAPDPKHLVSLLHRARHVTRLFTSDKGGMLVEVTGVNAVGQQEKTSWSLLARNNEGPYVPVLPAAALIKKLLETPHSPGAYYGFEMLNLAEILDEAKPYAISTSIERHEAATLDQQISTKRPPRLTDKAKSAYSRTTITDCLAWRTTRAALGPRR